MHKKIEERATHGNTDSDTQVTDQRRNLFSVKFILNKLCVMFLHWKVLF